MKLEYMLNDGMVVMREMSAGEECAIHEEHFWVNKQKVFPLSAAKWIKVDSVMYYPSREMPKVQVVGSGMYNGRK